MSIKNICDRMFSKHLLENISKIFGNDGYENPLLLSICKTFSEQTFTKHCQQMLFNCFVYTAYQTFPAKPSFLQLFYKSLNKRFQSNLP